MVVYGGPVNRLDEFIKIEESTAKEALLKFCKNTIQLYTEQYLRTPNMYDTQRLMNENALHDFPGMLGSLDCMHWEWRGCPVGWQGQFTGHVGIPTLILEAMASYDLWIWHAFFDIAGSHNDLTVLRHSHIFNEFIRGHTPTEQFIINGHVHHTPYYLTGGIYPQYATLMRSISHPHTAQEKVFAKAQECVHKDVERAFGVLQARWGITRGPVTFYDTADLRRIMMTCIILHNMTIEDERHIDIDPWVPPLDDNVSSINQITSPTVLSHYIHMRVEQISDQQSNTKLRKDLMAHIRQMYGSIDV
ncbi:putative nuclease HARBI1 [Tripterygium wilfordii]|uniref:putative nuclease HARBI1 n=1 Tax=Tripterygium wilfordii TaxID=458696 RepID=UPI0018F7F0A8|nr:putative nuclease HARBI1 [Tripterygium wilfordii]